MPLKLTRKELYELVWTKPRSEIAKQHRAERAREDAREVQHQETGERTFPAQSVAGFQPSGPGRKWKSPSGDTATPVTFRDTPQY